MRPILLATAATISLTVFPRPMRADIVVVNLGGALIPMEGKISDPKQPIISVTHEKFSKGKDGLKLNLPYRRGDSMFIEEMIIVPSRKQQYQRQVNDAQKGDVDKRLELAAWTIKNGMVPEFYSAIDLVLQADPENAKAKQILALKARLQEPIADSSVEQKYMTDTLPPGMKFKLSPHYILGYDTPDKKADERLELLERVYDTFLMYFAFKGRVLDPPKQRMMVALFDNHKQYLDFSIRLDPSLKSAAGYWSPDSNLAVFFAQGTYPSLEKLKKLSNDLEKDKSEAERMGIKNRGDLVRIADTIKLLILVTIENEDLEVVTHEATHQIAGNSGLFPRELRIPRFVQEGMAAYFESPNDATWSGVGAVNKVRLEYYRALADRFNDRKYSNIDFVVSDQIYTRAGDHNTILHAYGQAWAFTHFLMEKHFDKLQEFWRNLSRLPADMVICQDDIVRCFDAAFGKERDRLDMEWRRHMDSLKTDEDKLKEKYGDRL